MQNGWRSSVIRAADNAMGDARNHASRSLLWSSIDTFSQTGFAIVALAVLARLLSVEAIGEGSLAIMIVQLVSMPFELLFHDALIQRKELHRQHHATAFATVLVGALCGVAVLIAAAPWIAAQYDKPHLENLLRVAALVIPISAIASVTSAILRRNLAFAPLARRTLVGRVVGVSMGVATAWAGGGAWALVVMYGASMLLSTLVLLSDRRIWPGLQWSTPALRELLRFGAPNMVSQLLLLGNGRIFVVVAGFYLSDVSLGRFTLAFRIVEELRNTLSSAASQLALPLLSKRAHLPGQFAAVFAEATSFTACVLLPLYAGMAVTAGDLMSVVFGVKWQAAASVVQLLALAAMIVTLRQYSSIAVNAMGRPGANAMINAVVFVASLLLLMSGWIETADATAQLWVLRALLLVAVSVLATRVAAALPLAVQLTPLLAPLLATAMMCLAITLLHHTVLAQHAETLRLAISIAVGVVVYVLALLAVSPRLLKQFIGFFRAALLRHSYATD